MTRSTRTVPMLGAAAALVLALTACSSDSGGSEYCDLIDTAAEDATLADADIEDPEAMEQLNGTITEIADAAPDDIKGDWEIFADSMAAMAAPEPPAEDPGIMTAIENIDQHVQEECDIDMNG